MRAMRASGDDGGDIYEVKKGRCQRAAWRRLNLVSLFVPVLLSPAYKRSWEVVPKFDPFKHE
jgi:hypothetical protein